MKNYILILFLSINILFSQISTQKFRIEEIEYLNENGLVCVKFNLVNITDNTLYLSNKNLTIRLIKNYKLINWDYPKVHVQPFVKPVLKNDTHINDNKSEILIKKDPKDKLAIYFANKLFLKNLSIDKNLIKYKERIIENIIDDCIILLPKETYSYEIGLYSKKIDKTCKVSVKYSDSKRFTYFVDDNGKKIDVDN